MTGSGGVEGLVLAEGLEDGGVVVGRLPRTMLETTTATTSASTRPLAAQTRSVRRCSWNQGIAGAAGSASTGVVDDSADRRGAGLGESANSPEE